MTDQKLTRRKPTLNLRLSAEAKRLLAAVAEKHGITMTAVLEMSIRELARREGIA